jgi:hypothetical protein
MNGRLKTVGVVVACLACCLPLILAVAGVTTGPPASSATGWAETKPPSSPASGSPI